MNQNHEKLQQIGEQILASARNDLYLSMRFLDMALSGLGYKMNLSTPLVGTDGVDILYNPTCLIRLYREDLVALNRMYLHMVLHCMFRHEINREERDEELWSIACDIAVESILDGLDNRAVAMVVSSYREDMYDWLKEKVTVLTAEAIYRELKATKFDFDEYIRLKQTFYRDDHQFWQATHPEQEENQTQQQEQSGEGDSEQKQQRQQEIEAKWKQIDQRTQTNMETFFADFGKDAAGLLGAVRIENRERYDYKRFLERFVTMREEMRVDDDSFDYAFYSYGLELYGTIPLIEPLEYRESRKIRDFVIAIDTSDSCSGDVIARFLAETKAVLNHGERFFREMNLHIIQCDAGIQQDTVLHSPEELEQFTGDFTVKGYGGTDFRPVFEYVDRLIAEGQLTDLKGLLYFTDGFGAFPLRKPRYDTAFVFFRDNYTDGAVPPWAIKVILGPDELQCDQ